MDRAKLIEAIVKECQRGEFGEAHLRSLLKGMGDADMIVFANEIGIDTDKLFAVPQ